MPEIAGGNHDIVHWKTLRHDRSMPNENHIDIKVLSIRSRHSHFPRGCPEVRCRTQHMGIDVHHFCQIFQQVETSK